ncbi:MAG: nitroreductase family protein, partial [Proteobacteria bacterium]|nr:nitroreductase family protein [Pseudomonadota bacterium]
LLVVGYPADDARVPDIQRKPLEEFVSFIDE